MSDEERKVVRRPVSKLRFDPKNPRLPYSKHDEGDQEEVLEWMIREASIIELMGSISENGYFPGEPLLVAKTDGDYFEVVEGNRRLAALMLLLEPNLAPIRKKSVKKVSDEEGEKPKEVPVIIYDEREEILDYLGYRHITGIKEWGALQKARYLESLYNGYSDEIDEINKFRRLAKKIGSRRDYVAKLLTALQIYQLLDEKDYFGIEGLTEEEVEFSLLYTAIGYQNIYEFLELKSNQNTDLNDLNTDRLEELSEWIFKENSQGETRLVESRNLQYLAKIVDSEEALKKFRNGAPIKKALVYTTHPHKVFSDAISNALSGLERAKENTHILGDSVNTSDLENIQEIQELVSELEAIIKKKIEE